MPSERFFFTEGPSIFLMAFRKSSIAMEAGMFAVREERHSIGMDDFLKAIKKIEGPAVKKNLSDGMFV